MYAVIVSGGKQYRVQEGDTLKLETLPEEVGSSINFDKVLMVGNGDKINFGKLIDGCKVSATIVSQVVTRKFASSNFVGVSIMKNGKVIDKIIPSQDYADSGIRG